MLKPSIFAACLMAAPMMLPAPGAVRAQTADTVVATVNDQTITLGQMIVMRQSVDEQQPQLQGMDDAMLWDMVLDQLIRQTALSQEARPDAAVNAQLELQRRNTLAAAVMRQVVADEPDEQEVQAGYEQMFGSAAPVSEYHAAHILVDSRERADELKRQLDEGADFGELAQQFSAGPSGPNKGDLGWFSADQMVQPFSDVVVTLEKGQISDPVETQFGWHIIQLNDTRIKEAPTLDEVRGQIIQGILRSRINAKIEGAAQGAKVEKTEGLDAALISRTDLLEAE